MSSPQHIGFRYNKETVGRGGTLTSRFAMPRLWQYSTAGHQLLEQRSGGFLGHAAALRKSGCRYWRRSPRCLGPMLTEGGHAKPDAARHGSLGSA